jgi:cell division protein FtsW (lipid II flippase)
MEKRFSLMFLVAIVLLSFASVSWPYTYLCLAVFITVSVCSWFVYIHTFQFLRQMELSET